MAKLKGKKKAAFLARMKRGRLAKSARKITKKIRKRSGPVAKSRTKRRKSQPIKRRRKQSSSSMAKKRRGSSRKSKFGIPSVVKKAAAGIGLATIATVVISQVAPSAAPIIRPIAAFAGGGIVGVISDLVLSGGAGFLGNIFGGGSNGQSSGVSV